jgi:DNA-binding CsgD family transcriptional regulator
MRLLSQSVRGLSDTVAAKVTIVHAPPGGGSSYTARRLCPGDPVVIRSRLGAHEALSRTNLFGQRGSSPDTSVVLVDDAYEVTDHAAEIMDLLRSAQCTIVIATATDNVSAWKLHESDQVIEVPRLAPRQVLELLVEHGMTNPAAAELARETVGSNPGAIVELGRLIQQPDVRRAVPWRIPAVVTRSRHRRMREVVEGLSDRDRSFLYVYAAVQDLPAPMRSETLDKLSGRGDQQASQDVLLSCGVADEDDLRLRRLEPIWIEVLRTDSDFAGALRDVASTVDLGEHRARLLARSVLPSADPELSKELRVIAAAAAGRGEGLSAARDLDLSASLVSGDARASLLIDASIALSESQLLGPAAAALEGAEPLLRTPEVRARWLLQRGKVLSILGDTATGAGLEEQAGELFTGIDNDRAAQAFILAASHRLIGLETHAPIRLISRARQIAGTSPLVAIAADVIEGQALLARGDVAAARRLLSPLESLAETILSDQSGVRISEDVEHLLWAYLMAAAFAERYEDLRRVAERMTVVATRHGLTSMGVFAQTLIAGTEWVQGSYRSAHLRISTLQVADLSLAEQWVDSFLSLFEGSLGIDPFVRDQWALARSPHDLSGPHSHIRYGYPDASRAIGHGLYAAGRSDDRRVCELLEPLVRSLVSESWCGMSGNRWLPILVEAQIRSGARTAAAGLVATIRRWSERSGLPSFQLVLPWSEALLLGNAEDSDVEWFRVIEVVEQSGSPMDMAHVLRSRAEQLLASPRVDQAEPCIGFLERAEFLYEEGGALNFRDRSRHARLRAAELLSASVQQHSLHITEAERPIVVLVARGQTNKEVAQSVGLSVKSVERYLRNVYERNNLRNRAELVLKFQGSATGR